VVEKNKLVLGVVAGLFVILLVVVGRYKAESGKAERETSIVKTEGSNAGSSIKDVAEKPDVIDASDQSLQSSNVASTTDSQEVTNTEGNATAASQPSEKGADAKVEATPVVASIDTAQLEQKVTEILNKNPEIIIGALQRHSQNQQRAQHQKMEASLMKYQKEIEKESDAVVLGKKDADVKLAVFLDPNCPHCRPFSLALDKARQDFPDVAILVRHWPILGKDSEDVVRGLWAIKQQGEDKFNAATRAIASSDDRYTFDKLLAWVQDHNLNVERFRQDSESPATRAVLEKTKRLASDIGLEGTPTSLLIDKKGIRLVVKKKKKSLKGILTNATKSS